MSPHTNAKLFAPCPRGLENALAAELAELGASAVRTVAGGAAFEGDTRVIYRANLESRIATRVLLCLFTVAYRSEEDIYRAGYELDWPQRFDVARSIRVYLTAQRCPLKSLDFLTLRIKDAVCDRFRSAVGSRPNVDTRAPEVRIHAFLDATQFTLYLDTSGEPLFKRGARAARGEAPLKENLAAGILKLAGWRPGTALLDPMCGGGAFLVEAAQIALDIAPGIARSFGFEKLNDFDAALWRKLRAEAEARRKPVVPLPIYGSELYGDTLKLAHANLHAAGLAEAVQLKQANALEISAPAKTGVLVTNPPYGERMGERQGLAEFYPRFGDALKQKFAGWNCYILSADMNLPKLIKLQVSKRTPLYNGALECRLFEYKIVAGSMRGHKSG
ncbi:MAG: class I SAM-dependent RNA methyltransferase [Betaproteobacteria bacterium]|nr:MAG: class I SAM-dependent RNA methyltransferase [Betaproteobacteria bacterium]